MDRAVADNRIKKMKEIIYEEARDKANKIREQTTSQFQIEKNKILNAQKDKVNADFKNKLEQYSVKMKIERSTKQNAIRLSKMSARQEVIYRIRDDSKGVCKQRLGDKALYKGLLKKLIVQGLIKMMEKQVLVRCRAEDKEIVESLLADAGKDFTALIKSEVNVDFSTKVLFDEANPLGDNVSKLGGVVLSAQNGSILCNNTIDARLDLCYHDSIPAIRTTLFPDL